MKYWRLDSPGYSSDYKHTYVNGQLTHPFSLPGVRCDICQKTWSGSRVLPYLCPAKLSSHPSIVTAGVLSRSEHRLLQQVMLEELGLEGAPFETLQPGDDFQPCYLDVPSRPRADFLWPALTPLVVSERICQFFLAHCAEDVACCAISLGKIGRREAHLSPPVPESGEPEDLIDQMFEKKTEGIGPYYEILPNGASGYPRGGEPRSVCSGCGRKDINYVTRQMVMFDEMWRGQNVFFFETTLHIVVTDPIKQALAQLNPTNVRFEET